MHNVGAALLSADVVLVGQPSDEIPKRPRTFQEFPDAPPDSIQAQVAEVLAQQHVLVGDVGSEYGWYPLQLAIVGEDHTKTVPRRGAPLTDVVLAADPLEQQLDRGADGLRRPVSCTPLSVSTSEGTPWRRIAAVNASQ